MKDRQKVAKIHHLRAWMFSRQTAWRMNLPDAEQSNHILWTWGAECNESKHEEKERYSRYSFSVAAAMICVDWNSVAGQLPKAETGRKRLDDVRLMPRSILDLLNVASHSNFVNNIYIYIYISIDTNIDTNVNFHSYIPPETPSPYRCHCAQHFVILPIESRQSSRKNNR